MQEQVGEPLLVVVGFDEFGLELASYILNIIAVINGNYHKIVAN